MNVSALQYLEYFDRILEALEDNKSVDVLYNDFAKVSDMGDHGVNNHRDVLQGNNRWSTLMGLKFLYKPFLIINEKLNK